MQNKPLCKHDDKKELSQADLFWEVPSVLFVKYSFHRNICYVTRKSYCLKPYNYRWKANWICIWKLIWVKSWDKCQWRLRQWMLRQGDVAAPWPWGGGGWVQEKRKKTGKGSSDLPLQNPWLLANHSWLFPQICWFFTCSLGALPESWTVPVGTVAEELSAAAGCAKASVAHSNSPRCSQRHL